MVLIYFSFPFFFFFLSFFTFHDKYKNRALEAWSATVYNMRDAFFGVVNKR